MGFFKDIKELFIYPLLNTNTEDNNDTEIDEFIFNPMTTEELDYLDMKQKSDSRKSEEIDKARQLENTDVNQSIMIYEKYVSQRYINTSIPYDRLAIIYRRMKLYDREIKLMELGVELFSNTDRDVIVDRFKHRLEKAKSLKQNVTQ